MHQRPTLPVCPIPSPLVRTPADIVSIVRSPIEHHFPALFCVVSIWPIPLIVHALTYSTIISSIIWGLLAEKQQAGPPYPYHQKPIPKAPYPSLASRHGESSDRIAALSLRLAALRCLSPLFPCTVSRTVTVAVTVYSISRFWLKLLQTTEFGNVAYAQSGLFRNRCSIARSGLLSALPALVTQHIH